MVFELFLMHRFRMIMIIIMIMMMILYWASRGDKKLYTCHCRWAHLFCAPRPKFYVDINFALTGKSLMCLLLEVGYMCT